MKPTALVGGVGEASGLSVALIEKLLDENYHVAAIARTPKPLLVERFSNNADVNFYWGDMLDTEFVSNTISTIEQHGSEVEVYIHNAASLVLKPFLETTIDEFEQCWQVAVKTAVVMSHALLPLMIARKKGTIVFSGATASQRGNANSSPFAVAKFGLRALAQSLAREFGSRHIHIAHIVIDGVILGDRALNTFNMPAEKCIQANAMADEFIHLIKQHPSCWTHELDTRPFMETF